MYLSSVAVGWWSILLTEVLGHPWIIRSPPKESRPDWRAIVYDRSSKASKDLSPFCHLLLRTSSRQETWALFSSEFCVCLHYLCRTSPPVIFTSNQLSVFTNALLQFGNYSAHIHQAHIFMSFMRIYWDKTCSYCKCAWLWSLHQNSSVIEFLNTVKGSYSLYPKVFVFFYIQPFGLSVWKFTVRSPQWHSLINYGS